MHPETAHEYSPEAVKALFDQFPILYNGTELIVHNMLFVEKEGQTYRLTTAGRKKLFDSPYFPDSSEYDYITTWVANEFSKLGLDPTDYDFIVVDPETTCENCGELLLKHPENYVKDGFYCSKCHHVRDVREKNHVLDEY